MGLKIQRSTKEETKDAQTLKLASHADLLRAWDVSYQFLLFAFLFCETTACPHNTYNDGSSSTCKPCPTNSGHSLTGSRSISDCKCLKGHVGRPENGNPCTGEKELFWLHLQVMFRMFLQTEVFLSVSISLPSTRKRRFRAPEINAGFHLRSPERRFLKTSASRFFSSSFGRTKTVIHHILLALRILLKGCYRKSVILAFSCGRAIYSLRVDAFLLLKAEKKISVLKNIRIPVKRAA